MLNARHSCNLQAAEYEASRDPVSGNGGIPCDDTLAVMVNLYLKLPTVEGQQLFIIIFNQKQFQHPSKITVYELFYLLNHAPQWKVIPIPLLKNPSRSFLLLL